MTTPHKPAEDIGMRDVVKTPQSAQGQEGFPEVITTSSGGPGVREIEEFHDKMRKHAALPFQHPALTALKRLAGEFRSIEEAFQRQGHAKIANQDQSGLDLLRESGTYSVCAARLEQAIKEVEG